MASGRVRSLRIEGFTSIRSAEVQLGDLNVLVGANGSGKSNFIRVLEMLGRIVDEDLQFFVGVNGGASALLHRPSAADEVRVVLDMFPDRYEAVLVLAAGDELIFETERLWFDDRDPGFDEGIAISRGGHRETRLHKTRAGYEDPEAPSSPPTLSRIIELLTGCRVFHFHDTSVNAPPKRRVSTADNLRLRSDAGNLASYLLRLSDESGPAYRQIVTAVQQVAPFFRDFVLEPDTRDTLLLRWRQVGSDAVFSANQLSDGTLRFICLATLLLSPSLPNLVVLDEPELGLHPYAIVEVAEMLRLASLRSQVVVATQSVTLMNQFEMADLIVVERRGGASTFARPDVEKLQEWLAEYSLGELWEKNMIGGRPGPELPA